MSETMTPDYERRLRMPEDVLMRELDGEAVILNIRSEQYMGLDEVGTRMLTLLSAADSIGDAYQALVDEYDGAPETIRGDLDALIEKLVEAGVLEYAT